MNGIHGAFERHRAGEPANASHYPRGAAQPHYLSRITNFSHSIGRREKINFAD
jgi:hypothetical protein